MNENIIIHDVGAANFVPSHLCITESEIHHFEPDIRGLNKLKQFYANTNFSPSKVHFHNYALGDSNTDLLLNLNPKNTGSSFFSKSMNENYPTKKIKVCKALELIKKNIIPAPNILKIDVEGFELKVLDGYNLNDKNLFLIEVEITFKRNMSYKILKKLEEANFQIVKIRQHGDQTHVKPTPLQKRLQRWFSKIGINFETNGGASLPFNSLCTELTQIEVIGIKKNSIYYQHIDKINEAYGFVYRNTDGNLYYGKQRVHGIKNKLFKR